MSDFATRTVERTCCEVYATEGGDIVCIARFYAYRGNRKERQARAQSLATIFTKAVEVQDTLSYKLGQRLRAVLLGIRRAAVEFSVNHGVLSWVIARAADALLYPGYYLAERAKKGETHDT